MAAIRLEGFALHAATMTAVTLAAHDGPITFRTGADEAPISRLRAARTDFGVTITDDRGLVIDLVEHLLAALGGLGIRRGVLAIVEGPELPILDGGAYSFTEALARLNVPPGEPGLVVSRTGELAVAESRYTFEPGDAVRLEVETTFDHPAVGTQRAAWDGGPSSFRADIAPARTFGFAGLARELAKRGRAGLGARAAADDDAMTALRKAVIVFDEPSLAPRFANDEIARHKLLDLVGDLAFYGGPPLGRINARRPGHTATHDVVRRALDCGILSRR